MAGLVPAMTSFARSEFKTRMRATSASEAEPFFERLRTGMTIRSHLNRL
jgi:hypothetical protein